MQVSVDIENKGQRRATEIVQFYIQALVGDITRPVRELKGFRRMTLASGEKRTVKFSINSKELGFHNQVMKYVVESGRFNIWVGANAAEGLQSHFDVVN